MTSIVKSVLLVLPMLGFAMTLEAEPMMFRFDESSDALKAKDSGSLGVFLEFQNQGSVAIETNDIKFGKGSLKIVNEANARPVDGLIWQRLKSASPEFKQPIEKMTIGVWVKLAFDDERGFQIMRRDLNHGSGTNGYFTFTYNKNLKALRFDAAENTPVSFKTHLEAGKWVHYGMTYDHGEVAIYENGRLLGRKKSDGREISAVPETNQAAFFKAFGGMPSGTLVDDFYIDLKQALSPEQMAALAEDGSEKFFSTK